MQFEERTQREHDNVIFGILASTKGALATLGDANDREKLAIDINLFVQRIPVGEQFVGGIKAKDNNGRAVLVVNFIEPTSGSESQVVNVLPFGGIPLKNRVLGAPVSVFDHVRPSAKLRTRIAYASCGRLDVWELPDRFVILNS